MTPLAALLSPLRIGPVDVRNRVVSTSHQTTLVHDNLPTEAFLAYHEARARGGTGLIVLEATAAHPTGLLTAHTLGGFLPSIVPAYRRIGERLHAHDTPVFVQLFHAGREQIAAPPKAPAVAPSAIPSQRFKSEPRALSAAELRDVVVGYETAARYARDGGIDGIEVSMSHGYLAAQFLSPVSNHRSDGYNGDLRARARFPLEILQAVRRGAGDGLSIGVRVSANEIVPSGLDEEGVAAALRILIDEEGVDFVSLVLGHSADPAASTYIVPPPPVPGDAIVAPTAALRRALPGVVVMTTTRVVDLEAADALVASGDADLVGMTRALIADPDLVNKARSGRSAEIIECIGCNQGCIGHYHSAVPIGCMVNPRTGHESEPAIAPTLGDTPVVVVGAGPAGVAAALEASEGGARVTLVERDGDIGGQLRIAGHAPGHRELWERYRRTAWAHLRAAEVDVRLGTEFDPSALRGDEVVVLATGARPYLPELPAELPYAVVHAWEAIADPASVPAGEVLVADWGGGWEGLDAAEVLAGAGRRVTLACAGLLPGEAVHQYQRNLYLARLDDLGVRVLLHMALDTSAEMPRLRHLFSGRVEELPAIDALVLAQGRVPDDDAWAALEGDAGVHRAGDVLGPRSAEEAILEGAAAARAAAAHAAHSTVAQITSNNGADQTHD